MNLMLPLAGVEDLIGFLIFLLFLVISVVGHLANKWREMQEGAARRARPQRVPPQRRPLDDEVADFLRTAGERQRPGRPPAAAPRPASLPRVPGSSPRPRQEQPVEAQIVEPEPGRRESLASRHLSSATPGHLGEGALPDDRMQDHLRDVFSHPVSSLASLESTAASVPGESPAATASAAASLSFAPAGFAALLAGGESLRQAIILSEILNRPEDRWK